MTENVFGKQLQILLNYLGITGTTFAKRIGIRKYNSIQMYLDGDRFPDITTVEKIVLKYNVNLDWLWLGKGEMWQGGQDYFKKRFETWDQPMIKISDKIKAIAAIFECTLSDVSKRTGISKTEVFRMANDGLTEIKPDHIAKFRIAYPFIPYEWYL